MVEIAHGGRLSTHQETLFVLLVLDGQPVVRESLESMLATALAEQLVGIRGSTTARLQQAVEEANRILFAENDRVPSSDRRQGGVICLLIRGKTGYLAQVGSPRAYLSQSGQTECFSSREPGIVLGQSESISATLRQVPLAAESRILLTEDDWVNARLSEALVEVDAGELWESVLAMAPTSDSSAWLIGPSSQLPETNEWFASAPARSRPAASPTHAIAQTRPLSKLARQAWRWSGQVAKEVAQGVLPGPLSSPAQAQGQVTPDVQSSTLLQSHLPGIALAIPLLVVLLTGVLYWQARTEGDTQAAAYLDQARNALSSSGDSGVDQDAVRVYLDSALAQIDLALTTRPGWKVARSLRQETQARLDELDRTTRLTSISILHEYLHDGRLDRLLYVQGTVYGLDRTRSRLYRHQLAASSPALDEEATAVLLYRGQDIAGETVGTLIDMAWSPPGDTGRLLVLDSEGTLWAYTAGGEAGPLSVPGLRTSRVDDWRLSTYEDRLYALAPQRGQVLRFRPVGNSYGEPERYFPSDRGSENGISDMGIDGRIYILWENGQLRRYLGGAEEQLTVTMPDSPLSLTPALVVGPDEETAHVYIADAALQRIVQLTKEGVLVQQFRAQDPDYLSDIRGLCVDEAHGRLLIADGNRLLLAEVPPAILQQR
jgi:hypothetical protein